MTQAARVVEWDWKDQPSPADLQEAIQHATGVRVHIYSVATGSQEYAIVVSGHELADNEIHDAYRNYRLGEQS